MSDRTKGRRLIIHNLTKGAPASPDGRVLKIVEYFKGGRKPETCGGDIKVGQSKALDVSSDVWFISIQAKDKSTALKSAEWGTDASCWTGHVNLYVVGSAQRFGFEIRTDSPSTAIN